MLLTSLKLKMEGENDPFPYFAAATAKKPT